MCLILFAEEPHSLIIGREKRETGFKGFYLRAYESNSLDVNENARYKKREKVEVK